MCSFTRIQISFLHLSMREKVATRIQFQTFCQGFQSGNDRYIPSLLVNCLHILMDFVKLKSGSIFHFQ